MVQMNDTNELSYLAMKELTQCCTQSYRSNNLGHTDSQCFFFIAVRKHSPGLGIGGSKMNNASDTLSDPKHLEPIIICAMIAKNCYACVLMGKIKA